MAKRTHNLRLVQSTETESPVPIQEELHAVLGEFMRSGCLLRILRDAVPDGYGEFIAAMSIAVERLDATTNRLDAALIRLAHEGAPDLKKEMTRALREAGGRHG